MRDQEVFGFISKEEERQKNNIELIASENYCSDEVRQAVGSCLTNKYAEGYPGRRYYGGCENVDEIENLAIERAKEIFGAEHANVQPHSGSSANMGVYRAVLKPGDSILGMSLDAGGHLTHGYKLSFSGADYLAYSYGVDRDSETIDYAEVERLAKELKPKMIVAGASAYSRFIDYEKFREIADKVNAYLMVDMAHVAGLVAAKLHPNPVPYADFVTSTTHKTLRGPRGGLILCKEEFGKQIDRAVFPGIQGGPLEHIIAGKAVALKEALQPSFKEYAKQVVANAKAMAQGLLENGLDIVGGMTENHLMTLDLRKTGKTGKDMANVLERVGITANKNTVPNDPQSPFVTSGIRLGAAAMTTRGFKEDDMKEVARIIAEAIKNSDNDVKLDALRQDSLKLCKKYPLY